jgi:hypothetical protein
MVFLLQLVVLLHCLHDYFVLGEIVDVLNCAVAAVKVGMLV